MAALDLNEFQKQLAIADDLTKSDDARGTAFELAVRSIFTQVNGVRFQSSNKEDFAHSEEIDITFWNVGVGGDLYFLPNVLVTECKFTASPVSSTQVRSFAFKLMMRSQEIGLLIASSGVTGNKTALSSANNVIACALGMHIRIIVVTRQELESLTTTDSLVDLLQKKIASLAERRTSIL